MNQKSIQDRLAAARERLEGAGQSHVLTFFKGLEPAEQERLLAEVLSIDWEEISRLVESHVKAKPGSVVAQDLEPAPFYPSALGVTDGAMKKKYGEARRVGEELIRGGKVAAFTVAGGQGTRLGWDGPKGTFPATPIRNLSLFAYLAEYLLKVGQKYGQVPPWYIMTSPINDEPTRKFFEYHDYFGLSPGDVFFFPQGMLPAFDMRPDHLGEALLHSRGSLALSPDGHGGSLKALYGSGAIGDMRRRGIEQISYTQIDNPLVKVIDPLFLGLHALDGCEMSSKMVPKAYAKEKLGNFCMVDGRVTVIEYSDLPDELAMQRLPGKDGGEGPLRFLAGSIAIHVIAAGFVEALNKGAVKGVVKGAAEGSGLGSGKVSGGGGFALPYHRAEKKVAFVDLTTGESVEPASPNAVKLETFVFDALPLCKKSIIYETDRAEEFGPIKNERGVDSAESSRALQIDRAGRWLASRGVMIPRDGEGKVEATLEIQQTTAIEPEDLAGVNLPAAIEPGSRFLV